MHVTRFGKRGSLHTIAVWKHKINFINKQCIQWIPRAHSSALTGSGAVAYQMYTDTDLHLGSYVHTYNVHTYV